MNIYIWEGDVEAIIDDIYFSLPVSVLYEYEPPQYGFFDSATGIVIPPQGEHIEIIAVYYRDGSMAKKLPIRDMMKTAVITTLELNYRDVLSEHAIEASQPET